jgi:hypothetical protein
LLCDACLQHEILRLALSSLDTTPERGIEKKSPT